MYACVCNERKNSHGYQFASNKILRAFQLGKHLAASNRRLNYSGFKRRVWGFCWLSGKEPTCQCRRLRFNPRSEKIPQTMKQLSPSDLAVESFLKGPGAEAAEPMTCNH